jgi:hypothetical protein
VHGSDEEAKVYAELCEVVEEWIELLHRAGVPLPEPLAAKSSVANSCCALSRPFTAASRPKLLPPVKA